MKKCLLSILGLALLGLSPTVAQVCLSVVITPSAATVYEGAQQQFTGVTQNVGNQTSAVTWSMVSGTGTIDANGLFTAPAVPETDVIQATSVLVNVVFAQATITVVAPPPPPGGTDGPAALPQVIIDSSVAATPAPGAVTLVPAGTLSTIQTALNNANCGDTIELAEGTTYSGGTVVTFPNKACDDQHWIILRTSAPDSVLPPEGTRLTPCYAGVSSLPGRPALNCASTTDVVATINYTGSAGGSGPIAFAQGANHYRLQGLEITRQVGGSYYTLVSQNRDVNKIFYDRNWIHGTAQDETNTGISLNGSQYIAIVANTFTDFHCVSVIGTCTDAHAIGGGLDGVQTGPFKIDGNFLEGAGQGILFGGGSATFTPADITVTHNHFFKPMTWLAGQPGFVGGQDPGGKCPKTPGQCPFIVKNQFELKNGQRVLLEGNLIENVWGGFTQEGFSILLTPKSQAAPGGGNLCPLCMVQDITIRYNKISHSGTGISLADVPSDNGGCAASGQRWSLHDLILDDISAGKYAGNGTAFQVISGCNSQGETLNGLSIHNVTIFPDNYGKIMSLGGSTTIPMVGFTFANNIVGQEKYPVWNVGGPTCASSDVPLTSLNACWPGGYTFAGNILVSGSWGTSYPPSKWPAGQFFPTSATAIDFVNFNGGVGGDYTLALSSPYKNAGTDGKDPGADVAAINAAIAND